MAVELQVFLNGLGRSSNLKELSFRDWHYSFQAAAFVDGLRTFFNKSSREHFLVLEVIDLGWMSCNCLGGLPKFDVAVIRFHEAMNKGIRPGKLHTLRGGGERLALA